MNAVAREVRRSEAFAPTLTRFQGSDAFVRGIIGPVGSGKSSACVVEIPRRANRQEPDPLGVRRTRWAIIRNTYRELTDTTRKTFCDWIPARAGTWSERDFTWRGDWNDGRGHDVECEVLFRSLDRPEDVQKLLSLELTGAYVNEARQTPKAVLDMLKTRVGRYPSVKDGGPTWSGIWLDSNPWPKTHWGYKLFSRDKPEGFELFEQPGARLPNAENVENLVDGYYGRLMAGADAEWIACYIDAQYPSSDVGSIFGAMLDALERRGGLTYFGHPVDGVYTSWDLGVSDSTAIWFWRFNGDRMPDLVDHYENHGQPASHYFNVLRAKPYRYVHHWLPHDALQRSWQTGVGIVELFIREFGSDAVRMGPDLSLRDGIGAARWLLEQPIRIHPRCAEQSAVGWSGLEALREYRFDWDEDTRSFSTRPLHNWASHTADAFRYLACVVRHAELASRPPVIIPPAPARALRTLTLDELYESQPSENQRTRV